MYSTSLVYIYYIYISYTGDAEPRLLVIDAEPIGISISIGIDTFIFGRKKTSPIRDETKDMSLMIL